MTTMGHREGNGSSMEVGSLLVHWMEIYIAQREENVMWWLLALGTTIE